uniref:Chromosome 1 open reading frame 21 n=1 Tax=Gallus gallus TaxID=9031 RepID=A0A8V0YE58_CHICK
MGCASAKHVSTVQNEEETQKGKNYQNGDVFGDEYRIKPVEEVKYMKNGGEDDQKIAARNQENLEDLLGRESWNVQEKSASSNVRLKSNKEIPGLVHQPRANMHISESQQEFFRMLDEKIEKGRDYCSEEEDVT